MSWLVLALLAIQTAATQAPRPTAAPAECPGRGEPVKLSSVIRGVIGSLTEKTELAVRSEAEWKELWGKLALPMKPAMPPPAVDFSRDMVVGVAAGQGRGIVEVEITSIERKTDCILVTVAERGVPPKMSAAQFAQFRPFHFVKMAAVAGKPVFRYVKRVEPAPPKR
jgi:hypothetical protein